MSIWPHSGLDEKFEELSEQSEAIEAQIDAATKALAALKHAYRLFANNVADTVRIAIMQRDNAEAQLSKPSNAELRNP